MEHFHQFTASLKQLENEKSAKSEAKIQAKQAWWGELSSGLGIGLWVHESGQTRQESKPQP